MSISCCTELLKAFSRAYQHVIRDQDRPALLRYLTFSLKEEMELPWALGSWLR